MLLLIEKNDLIIIIFSQCSKFKSRRKITRINIVPDAKSSFLMRITI